MERNLLLEMQRDAAFYTDRIKDINTILTQKWVGLLVIRHGVTHTVKSVTIVNQEVMLWVTSPDIPTNIAIRLDEVEAVVVDDLMKGDE